MTWEVLFCFRQILLLCWCHYTCLLYSLIKQLPGWDSIAEFLSVLDNTVSSSLLSLASDCSERLQVPLVWWPYIFCQGSALVFYNWSHRWGSHVLWCSFSKDCQGSAMNDVPQYFALLRGWVSYLYSAEFPFKRFCKILCETQQRYFADVDARNALFLWGVKFLWLHSWKLNAGRLSLWKLVLRFGLEIRISNTQVVKGP